VPGNSSSSPKQSPDAAPESPSPAAKHTTAFRDGNALQEVARFAEAIACYERAISIKPNYVEAYRNRGNALRQLGRLAEAVASYDHAIALRPNVTSYTNRGNVLRELKRTEEALQSYDRAIALNPHYAEIHNNRGSALQELGRFEEAAASYQRAIALKPDYAEGYNNLGVALTELKRFDEAIADFDQAIALKGDYAEATWNRGLTRLLTGQYASGWRDYEARKKKRVPVGDRTFPKPLWLGDAAISGKTILVHWEQGFGDTIQFSRYLKLLANADARVLFAPQRPLKRLMETLDPRVQIVDLDEPLPAFDFHCALMSLPLAFGTEPWTIPRAQGYLHVDHEKASAWRGMLGERTKPRIGIAWSGSPEHRNDRTRSIEFRRIAALFDDRCQFISLQKEVSEEDRPWLAAAKIVHLGDVLDDFADTAALCSLVDIVISVDTSLAHLAGALGTPVWVLLPYIPDWRWMLDRSDTPWYPTMTLIRQRQRGDWDGTLRQVNLELASRFGT
jgi:tetratricopeptide (TPR) repeat protein